jgi:glycosyltransferase involved in cell wall biosynthesis
MKVALVYDRVNKWGGAERVLLALHEIFPKAPLYTSVYNPKKATWARVFDVRASFLQQFPYARESHELYAPLMPLAFESFSFDEYDLVITVTSEAAKGILTKGRTKHICYCLTPTRYLWSGYDEYFSNKSLRFLSDPIVRYLKAWDLAAAARPDIIVAISQEVQRRINTFYHREADVIYPPLMLEDKKTTKVTNKGDYFLVVSRLVPYKRIDIAIDACNTLGVNLKIIGSGVAADSLKNRAGKTIEFLGHLTDQEILDYYRNCRALLFPGIEDFGLTVVEAQSMGKPVIAYNAGGALETIIDGKTGLFFTPQTAEALLKTLQKFDILQVNPDACREQARKFTKDVFKKHFLKLVGSL